MTARHLKFSDAALDDLVDIHSYSVSNFGWDTAVRYDLLIKQALADIKEDPDRPGSTPVPSLGAGFRKYRIELSGRRSGTGISRARHVVVFVEVTSQVTGVSRILHDSMVVHRYVPRSHRSGADAFIHDDE